MSLKIISDLFCFVEKALQLLCNNMLQKKNNKTVYFGNKSLSFLAEKI